MQISTPFFLPSTCRLQAFLDNSAVQCIRLALISWSFQLRKEIATSSPEGRGGGAAELDSESRGGGGGGRGLGLGVSVGGEICVGEAHRRVIGAFHLLLILIECLVLFYMLCSFRVVQEN